MYVVDIGHHTFETYPIPLSAYGIAFTPDSHYLLIGSHETGKILRIDLGGKKIERTVQAEKTIHGFYMAPSGKYFLVENNMYLSPRKLVDVRRTATLDLITSIPIADLFPGCKGSPGFSSTGGGHYLLAPKCDASGAEKPASGIWVFVPPDDIAPPPAGSAADGKVRHLEALALGRRYGKKNGLHIGGENETLGSFLPVAVASTGEVFAAGIRGYSETNPRPGTTEAAIVKLDPRGKLQWERRLPKKGFGDHAGGVLAPTKDGGCVAYFLAYVNPLQMPNARVVRLAADGRILWDHIFPGHGAPDSPYANTLELRSGGSVFLEGDIYPNKKDKKPWTCELDASGKEVRH